MEYHAHLEQHFQLGFEAMLKFIADHNGHTLARYLGKNAKILRYVNAMGGLSKLADFRLTPALFGIFLVAALAVSYFLSPAKAKRVHDWVVSSIPIFFIGLVLQLVGSAGLLVIGGFRLYFSFSVLWFGADMLYVVLPFVYLVLALVLWYVLKANSYNVRVKMHEKSKILMYGLLPSIFILQQLRSIYGTFALMFSMASYLGWGVCWVLSFIPLLGGYFAAPWFSGYSTLPQGLSFIGTAHDILTNFSPYMSLIGNLGSVLPGFVSLGIVNFGSLMLIQMLLPLVIMRIVREVYLFFRLKFNQQTESRHASKIVS